MTDLSNKLDNVKKTIRALLLSTQQGLTMKLLADDYRENGGTDIPYQEFGHSTLEAFLRSIPDVVKWTQVYNRGQRGYILTGVPTESTQHIKKLVDKQKLSISGYANPYRDLSRTGGVYRERTNFTNRASAINNYSNGNIQEKPHQQKFVAACHPTVGSIEKNQIKDLLLSYPKGLRLINFERAFNQMYGISFSPGNFGFRTLKECLLSLPDIVQLVTEFDCYRLYPVNTSNDENSHSKENVENVKTQHSRYSVINDKFRYDLRRVLSLYPNGISLSVFASEFERVINRPLNCAEYGFNNGLEMVSYMTDVFHVYRQSPHEDFVLFHSKIGQSEELFSNSDSPCLTNDCSINITSPSQVKYHVVDMLLKYRDGIMLNDFEEEFQIRLRDVSWKKWGFAMFKDFILALGHPVKMVSCKSGNILVIHNSYDNGISEHAGRDSAKPDSLYGIVMPGIDYTYASTIAVNNCSDNFVPVYVSAINSPSEIYFRLEGVDDELNSLMEKIEEFYNSSKANEFNIPDQIVKLSMICTALSPDDNTWYRGKISKFVSPVCVEVFFVDYGLTCTVNKKRLRFLTKELLCLPAQAIKARLSQVEPMNGIWTTAAKAKLSQLCPSTSVVMAKITNTSYKNTISVMLCNTNGSEDVHINSLLIKNKLAVLSSDDDSEVSALIENKNVQNPVGLAELSYQAQIEYYKNLNQQCERMMRMEMPEYSGIDMKVVEKMKNDKLVKSRNGSLSEVEPSASKDTAESPLSATGQPAETFGRSNDVESRSSHHQIRNFSKVFSLDDYDIHLINYMGKPYITSGDISLLIWGIDVLKKMLAKKNMKDDSITLTRQTAEDLFRDLEKNKIKHSPGGKCVSLFPLESVRDVMCNFKRHEHLPKLVKMMESFDPCDPHWTANFEKSVAHEDKEGRTASLLQELTEERLQIIGEMKLTSVDMSRLNKLRDLEERISQLKVNKMSEAKCGDRDYAKKPEQLKPRRTSEAIGDNPSEQPELHHSPESSVHNSDLVREVTAVNQETRVIPRSPLISDFPQPSMIPQPYYVLPMYYNQMAPGTFYNPVQRSFMSNNVIQNIALNQYYFNFPPGTY